MSVFLYEPYYNFDRFCDEAFNPKFFSNLQGANNRLANAEGGNQVERALKPRSVYFRQFFVSNGILMYIAEWISMRTLKKTL